MQSAEGGTLFLDEVADLPLHMQVKLLRVIQEKSVRPIGEQREAPIDVRIVSATHKNLSELVANGRFREDLYYRVNVIEMRVPPLRERSEDILPLATTILARLSQRLGGETPSLTTEAASALQSYAFPGNVREMENILERALTMRAGSDIEVADLQLRSLVAASVESLASPQGAPAASTERATGALGDQLESLERDAIVRALEQTRYNKTAAAKLLGMTFRALRYRVKKLGIE
jgi:two-component system, NtrC family, response regulator PilR